MKTEERNQQERLTESPEHTRTLKANWDNVKGKLRSQYSNLTESDLTYNEGKEDELYDRVGRRVGRTSDQIRTDVESWLDRADWDNDNEEPQEPEEIEELQEREDEAREIR